MERKNYLQEELSKEEKSYLKKLIINVRKKYIKNNYEYLNSKEINLDICEDMESSSLVKVRSWIRETFLWWKII